MKNVLLFGYGKMGSSIARGWMIKKLNFNVFIIEKQPTLRKIASNDGFKVYENIERLKETQKSKVFEIIFLAVKPQQMEETVKSFSKFNLTKTVFVSIAAGLSFSWFRNKLNKEVKIVRAMPNLPASIGFGVTGYCKSKNLSEEENKDVYALLSAFSKVIYLRNESLIDNVTAISGSGPGYIFYLVEALSQIGVDHGLSMKDAKILARETLIGSARLVEVSNIDPKILKKNVTSPGGTTEAGLLVLESEKNGLYPLLKSTINNAIKRAKELNSDG
jgi:pyrroline-5-carboxylate reductase